MQRRFSETSSLASSANLVGAVAFISLVARVGGDESCVMGQVEEAVKGSCSAKCINYKLKGKNTAYQN